MVEVFKNKFSGRFLYRHKLYDPNTFEAVYHFLDRHTGDLLIIVARHTWKSTRSDIEIIDEKLSDIISNERSIKINDLINKI